MTTATDFARVRQVWGQNIRDLRKRAGMTQTALARRCHSSQSGIARWESGRANVPDTMKLALARALRVSADELFPLASVEAWERACRELLVDDEGRAYGRHARYLELLRGAS